MEEITNFIARVRDAGQGSLEVTIPKNITESENINVGDFVKILIIRLVEQKSEMDMANETNRD